MSNRRVLVKRRKAVKNIRKITRTMQLIATARYQAALSRATATKPYTEKLAELVAELTKAAEDVEHPLMKQPEDVNRSAMVAITSMRGLCGGYNANVLRSVTAHLDEKKQAGIETDVHMVGKKGVGYFKFLRRPVSQPYIDFGEPVRFEEVEPLANELIRQFTAGEIDSAYVGYMHFYSVGRQRPRVMQLLPLTYDEPADEEDAATAATNQAVKAATQGVEFEFTPNPEELLNELLPATVRVRLFQCFTDATVSEQIARMVAMKSATDAAGDMMKSLTRQYNRARQTAITMELLDIVGGANALA